MSAQLFSPLWYRAAALRPRLRRHVRVSRHRFRGRRWYLLSDPVSGRNFRLNEAAWALVGRFDGRRTLERLWQEVCGVLDDAAPTQDEVLRLLGQLHQADLVQMPDPPELPELERRKARSQRNRWLQYLRSPLSVRIPLWDPDRFLRRTLPLVGWMFTRAGFLAWLLLVASAAWLGARHFDALVDGWQDRLFSLQGAVALAVLYPLVKGLHELAHGWAVRKWGGEVHEMGIMLLVFLPVPYVDASASARFESPAQRMTVAAAGILVELGIAALAMWFWVYAEPGPARALAWQLILIGTVSSVLVNGNPLLKFDGYYVLSDALQIPNLARRANAHLGWLAQRHLLGDREAEPVVQAPGEAPWLAGYAVLSFFYRVVLVVGILLFVSGRFFAAGVVLALWALIGTVLVPAAGRLRRVMRMLALRRRRFRALMLAGGVLFAGWVLLAWVPLPRNLVVQGVSWVPENARLHVDEPCLVEAVTGVPGAVVAAGDPVIRCANPELRGRLRVAEARLAQARARFEAAIGDRLERELAQQALDFVGREVARLRERVDALTVRAHRGGTLALPRADDLPGRLLPRGEGVAWVLAGEALVVRAFVDQVDWEAVQRGPVRVTARRAGMDRVVLPARILRRLPGATRRLPSRALGVSGGGPWPEVPGSGEDGGGPQTLRPGFIVDLELPGVRLERPDERVFLRFELPPEPLSRRLRRALHGLFLRHFDV